MPAPKRPTVRTIAEELKVSPITVSRALREQDNVRPALARRIRAHAQRRGYRRDPVLAEVMSGLGRSEGARYRETVAFIWTHESGGAKEEEAGARAAAGRLGYRLEVIKPWRQNLAERDVSRILWARGIRGVLLSPNASRPDPRYELDWPRFAAVLVGSSLVNTGLTRVARDYYSDAKLALARLADAGARRIGLALDSNIHQRTDRRYAAAFNAFSPPGAPEVFVVDPAAAPDSEKARFLRWLAKDQPDAVLSEFAAAGSWMPADLPHARLHLLKGDHGPGVQPDFARVGAEAMRTLDGLLRADRLGLLDAPATVLIAGRWRN